MRGIAKGLLATGLCLGLGAGVLQAQTPVHFGVAGGISTPSGSTSDGLKTGWHGMGLVQILPASSPVGFQVDAAYHQMKFDGAAGKDEVFDGTADVLYQFKTSAESKFRPYVIGGGGLYHIKAKPDVGASSSSTKFGLNAGGGFNLGTTSTSFFVESRFHDVLVSGQDFHFIPISIGVRFGGNG